MKRLVRKSSYLTFMRLVSAVRHRPGKMCINHCVGVFCVDYVGYIKKIMKMMQLRYTEIRKVECEMNQMEELVVAPITPRGKLSEKTCCWKCAVGPTVERHVCEGCARFCSMKKNLMVNICIWL